jgi:hypothetical protein
MYIEKDTKRTKSKFYYYYVFGLMMISSLLPRLLYLNLISSWWRSSQTLLMSFWFQKEGISLFHAQLPLFGPPWEIPLEFPLYQAICTLFSNITNIDITLASRIIGLTCFYLSAIVLFLLCYEIMSEYEPGLIIVTVYMWLPYTIRYSTEILIDYLAVLFALSYIYCLRKYFTSPRKWVYFILTIICGVLAGMVKVTTMPIVILPAIFIVLDHYNKSGWKFQDFLKPKELWHKVANDKVAILQILKIALLAIIPLIAIILWTNYADTIKNESIYTSWLASDKITDWTYGTWEQKIGFYHWLNWLKIINSNFFLGGILKIFFIAGIILFYKMPRKHQFTFGIALSSVFITLFIFFNLYLHDYYYIAISPYMSILIGLGIYCVRRYVLQGNNWYRVFLLIFSFFVILKFIDQNNYFLAYVYSEIEYQKNNYIDLATKVEKLTPEGENIIAFQTDWYPDFLLYTQRKGFTLSPREYDKYSCNFFTENEFTTIVVVDPPDDFFEVEKVLDCFTDYQFMGDDIYRIVR